MQLILRKKELLGTRGRRTRITFYHTPAKISVETFGQFNKKHTFAAE